MNIFGIIKNIYTIITQGIYEPIDGDLIWEDSAVYDLAFEICYAIGTCG